MTSSKAKGKRIARLERELSRIRHSPSLRLGAHITNAMRRPWRAPFLFFTLPWMMLTIGLEMLGRKPVAPIENKDNNRIYDPNNTVVMFPTNGVGFGHFTRMLAVAKRMKEQDSTLEIVFFTTMPTLHLLKPYGIAAHHISGPKYFTNLETGDWNTLLEEELTICIETHRPKKFIFDGAFPYRGMLRAISNRDNVEKIWMRRGTFRKGTSIPVDSIDHFDLIVHPEDSVPLPSSEIEHGVDVMGCSPIVLLDRDEMLTRESARNRLQIPPDSIAIYVQLGAGEINDIGSEIRMTIDALLAHPNVHIIIGESMIGKRLDISFDRVHIIRDYPNSMYFPAFDATIQAGGYNSFHEIRNFGMPTLFYPNMETGMDDQVARCKVSESEGWGIVLTERKEKNIKTGVQGLLKHPKVQSPGGENGANELAKRLVS
tara:strand:+ start:228 stop:1514 length:1287 start_codon:yes stop_codon:yes gene_type:complete